MNKVIAVVVTYNRIELLKECVKALQQQTYPCDILIVDNASTDGTEEYINKVKKNYDNLHYMNTGANIGGAGGFNLGMRWAVEVGYEYVWVMDDDCITLKNTLQELLKAETLVEDKCGFLASKILWRNKKICVMNIPRRTMFTQIRDFDSNLPKITLASFVSLLIPIKVVKKVGLPIKEFFIWTDDWEYTRRISKIYPCYLVNNSIAIHKSLSNIGANISKDSVDKLNRYYYLYRNDVYLYKREGLKGFMYEAIRLFVHIFKVILFSKNNKLKRLKYIVKGTADGLNFKPVIEYVDQKNKY